MKPDPVIDEIRRIRHEMSAEMDHDPKRLLEYYADIQSRYQSQLADYGGSRTKSESGRLGEK